MPQYAPTHMHNEMSPDGAGKSIDMALYAKALGYDFLGLSNHGTTAGLLEHVMACEEVGIGYLLGCEGYHMLDFARPPLSKELLRMSAEEQAHIDYLTKQYHLSIFIKNKNPGYKNMMNMLSEANIPADEGGTFYRRPIITNAMLEQYHDGLMVFTGCISSYICQHIISGSLDEAWQQFCWFKNLFGPDFYVEVMPNQAPGQRKCNLQLIEWANATDTRILLSEDAHYVRPQDYEKYLILQAIRGIDVDSYKADYSQLHMKSISELQQAWGDLMGEALPDAYLQTSYDIAVSCQVDFDRTVQMPDIPGVENVGDALIKAAQDGILEKHLYTMDGKNPVIHPPYLKRLSYEIEQVLAKNFGAYMLMYYYMCQYAKGEHIQVGARGSACGSLLAYVLGITTIDPIIYKTVFERFISPDRPVWDMPDIDLDVPDKHKQKIVDYFKAAYPGSAEQVATFGTFGVLSVINKLVAVLGFENGDAKRFEDAIEEYVDDLEEPQLDLQEMLEIPELLYLEQKYKAVTMFCWLFRQKTYIGKHAAGIAITKGPITDRVAIMYQAGTGSRLTSEPMKGLARDGIMKADILGLNLLTMLSDAEEDAGLTFLPYRKTPGTPKNFYDIDDIEEPEVFERFRLGKTTGLFQSEKRTPKSMYKKILAKQPGTARTLAVVNAANRPASLREHAFENYMAALDGKTFSSIGRPIIFQEDIMAICRDIAGLSWEQVSKVLKALKKFTVNNPELEKIFVEGCKDKGYEEGDAREVWNSIRRYTFPYSHAIIYTQYAMRQAYIAEHHKFSFWYALIKNEAKKPKRRIYTIHARQDDDIWFMLPNANGSAGYGKVVTSVRPYIQEGMMVLDGIGEEKALAIEAERIARGPYKSIKDMEERLPKSVFNKTVRDICYNIPSFACFKGVEFMELCRTYNDTIDTWR